VDLAESNLHTYSLEGRSAGGRDKVRGVGQELAGQTTQDHVSINGEDVTEQGGLQELENECEAKH
jgi:hypothetical protein